MTRLTKKKDGDSSLVAELLTMASSLDVAQHVDRGRFVLSSIQISSLKQLRTSTMINFAKYMLLSKKIKEKIKDFVLARFKVISQMLYVHYKKLRFLQRKLFSVAEDY